MMPGIFDQLQSLYHSNRSEFWRIVRYLLVGGWNTIFGILVYTVLFETIGNKVHYLLLAIPSNILAITNAYICYKLIVFRTKGNIIREYLRCYLVYGTSALLGMSGLFILVSGLKIYPVLANILVTFTTVAISYFGHKYFSFRSKDKQC